MSSLSQTDRSLYAKRAQDELASFGLKAGRILYNLPLPRIVEESVSRGEGILGERGELIVHSGKFTGRSPKDKFIVKSAQHEKTVDWGKVNQPIQQEAFDYLFSRVNQHLGDRDVFVYEGLAGADDDFALPVRIISQKAWHHHFVQNMFRDASKEVLEGFKPGFTIINACGYYESDKIEELGLNSDVFVVFDLEKNMAIIGGTEYGGEMKKGIFSVLNYLLPEKGVLPMHCSANCDDAGVSAVFFGLSGTGKTTLSSDSKRQLIGDDEHGWTDKGVFNFEGGCYAKTIALSPQNEPEIWNAIRFGAILENVDVDFQTRSVDYDSSKFTENTRVSYSLSHIDNLKEDGKGGHPVAVIFLTADAYGVIPPVARLSPEQASYHFLSGFTAKVAGTERGIKEPQPTFSACFGSPFMMRHPSVYGSLLADKIRKHNVPAYLVNTGWFGGGYNEVSRMSLPITRQLIHGILDGSIANATFEKDEIFGYDVAISFGSLGKDKLDQATAWSSKEAYQEARAKLASLFAENFKKFDKPELAEKGGPKL